MNNISQYEPGTHPNLPPPLNTTGVVGWLRSNLFSSFSNTVLTLLSLYILWLIIPPMIEWAFVDATFVASSKKECQALSDGACWAVIVNRFDQFVYGFYPATERWRVNIAFILFVFAIIPILFSHVPMRRILLWHSYIFPFIAYYLIVGGFLGLEYVPTHTYGGFMLTMIIGVTGILISLPLGILLALGRQSHMPTIRLMSVVFIEFFRGVPLITLLFVASVMLSYFLPPGSNFDLLLRVLIMVTLFSSAYMAEVIRGGLQSLPKGQTEAAQAMGLSYWKSMYLIILPQALKVSIPGIVNTFIGLYKDTTLVVIIGLLDPLGIGRSALADGNWLGLVSEVYVFVAIFFFLSCFAMSRYSIYLEKKLHTGH